MAGVKNTIPDPPDWLPDIGRNHWDELCLRIIEARGAVHNADLNYLATAVQHFLDWKRLDKVLEDEPHYIPLGKNGAIQQHPAINTRRTAMYDYRACLVKLGLTTVDRIKTKGHKEGAKEPTTGRKQKAANVVDIPKSRFAK